MEAVQNAEELRPDLILLDIDLTKLNGIKKPPGRCDNSVAKAAEEEGR